MTAVPLPAAFSWSDAELRRHGLFAAEGAVVARRARATGHRLVALLRVDDAARSLDARETPGGSGELHGASRLGEDGPGDVGGLDGWNPQAPRWLVGPAEARALAGFHLHRGLVALCERPSERSASDVLATAARVVVCIGVNTPTNLGSILRSAAAFGFDGVLLDATATDPLFRRAVRVAVGESLRMPWARATDCVGVLAAGGFVSVALTPNPVAASIDEVGATLRGTARVALVFGPEGPGLDDAALGAMPLRARIPMSPSVDSLNVAAAAAIACFLLRRVGG